MRKSVLRKSVPLNCLCLPEIAILNSSDGHLTVFNLHNLQEKGGVMTTWPGLTPNAGMSSPRSLDGLLSGAGVIFGHEPVQATVKCCGLWLRRVGSTLHSSFLGGLSQQRGTSLELLGRVSGLQSKSGKVSQVDINSPARP